MIPWIIERFTLTTIYFVRGRVCVCVCVCVSVCVCARVCMIASQNEEYDANEEENSRRTFSRKIFTSCTAPNDTLYMVDFLLGVSFQDLFVPSVGWYAASTLPRIFISSLCHISFFERKGKTSSPMRHLVEVFLPTLLCQVSDSICMAFKALDRKLCVILTFLGWYLLLQVSISPTFYEQLLHAKIPKVQKKTVNSSSFLHFWDLRVWKFHINTMMKLTPGGNTNPLAQKHGIWCKRSIHFHQHKWAQLYKWTQLEVMPNF